MLKRLVISVLVVLILGLTGLFFLQRFIRNQRAAQNTAALLEKKVDIKITIVEGKRREQIAQQFAAAGITSYADFMAASEGKEGILFPDTYRFFPNTVASTVVKTMTDNFIAKTAGVTLTKKDIILASIVEREAKNDADRALIAGVYQNRLNQGMALESDPTVEYAKDTLALAKSANPLTFTFWGAITQDDYKSVIQPYNTYLNPGLPPTAICDPGLASFIAAHTPAQNDYLYIYYKDGKLLLAKTLAQHVKNQQ